MFNYAIAYAMSVLATEKKREEKGAAMVEYALLVAGMALVVGVVVLALEGKITTLVNGIKI